MTPIFNTTRAIVHHHFQNVLWHTGGAFIEKRTLCESRSLSFCFSRNKAITVDKLKTTTLTSRRPLERPCSSCAIPISSEESGVFDVYGRRRCWSPASAMWTSASRHDRQCQLGGRAALPKERQSRPPVVHVLPKKTECVSCR